MIMIPDAENNAFDDRHYIGELIHSIPLSQREIARRLGLSDRYVRKLAAERGDCSYVVQFALEALLYAINHPESAPVSE